MAARTRSQRSSRIPTQGLAAGSVMIALACAPSSPESPPSPPADQPIACTEIGCGPSFAIDLQRAGSWPRATYRIEVQADGETFTCESTVPLICSAPPACPRTDVQLVEIGCALAVGEQAIGGLQFVGDPPGRVEIRVLQDDVEIGAASYEPQYATSYPNGPECPPACTQAPDAVLVLDATEGE